MVDKQKIVANVEKHQGRILEAERAIWRQPETGFKEWKTSAYLEAAFEALGYTLVRAGDVPGFYADLDTGRPGPCVAVLGEMDSLICKNHPDADPETGAVHACGHNVQCATLLGVAAALKEKDALSGLSGRIRLIAVPAEELIEIGYRDSLRAQGVIRFLGGKAEFMRRGFFTGVDLAMMIHTGGLSQGKLFALDSGCNGCLAKEIEFTGKAAHAGGSPETGVNALYAATLGVSACNALRETFVDGDHIRFHPIITKGGQAVNAIPDSVKLESFVRGRTVESMVHANQRINRALAGAAAAMGAGVLLHDRPGYMPLKNDPEFARVAVEAMAELVGRDKVERNDNWGTGSTDMGDLSMVMPVVQPTSSGAKGAGHGADYRVVDPVRACVLPAQCLTLLCCRLLEDGAAQAQRIASSYTPPYPSQQAYLEAAQRMAQDVDAVRYGPDGRITIDPGC